MLAAIGIAEPQSAESAFDEDNAAQDVGNRSKARFGPRDLREGKDLFNPVSENSARGVSFG